MTTFNQSEVRAALDGADIRVLLMVLFHLTGDRRWLELRAQYTELVRQELARHGGEEMNLVGDQLFAVFDAAAAAIRCGCAIRDGVQGLGMAVKVGVHA